MKKIIEFLHHEISRKLELKGPCGGILEVWQGERRNDTGKMKQNELEICFCSFSWQLIVERPREELGQCLDW